MMRFKIEKGIQRPHFRGYFYPFEKMKVGDSFAVNEPEAAEKVRGSAAHYAAKYGRGKKFSVLRTDEGCRCWRIK
jgi:hypothetical protein